VSIVELYISPTQPKINGEGLENIVELLNKYQCDL
jgi:hypothetical protein